MDTLQFFSTLVWQALVLVAIVYFTSPRVLRGVASVVSKGQLGKDGFMFELREVKEVQARLTAEVDALRFLVSGFVTDLEMVHLRKLADTSHEFFYERRGQRDESFILELIRLWTLGLIEKREINSFRQIPLSGNLHNYAMISDRGQKYLTLRNDFTPTAIRGDGSSS
jgi:hypothetical protein